MQINFHSLLWSYLARVLICLAMTVFYNVLYSCDVMLNWSALFQLILIENTFAFYINT